MTGPQSPDRPTPPTAAPQAVAPGERFWSYKRLLQAGSAAAALGSILGLAFTVGDRVTGVFGGGEAKPRVVIDSVGVEVMQLRTFLESTEGDGAAERSGYPPDDLESDVLAVTVRTRYEHAPRLAEFPATLTLEKRDSSGRTAKVGAAQDATYLLDEDDDMCDCQDSFFLPEEEGEYRVRVQIRRLNSPNSDPLAVGVSDWYPR